MNMKKLSVIGLGKLGLCAAACFASKGFKVTGVDIDINKINKINKGVSPIEETGLAELVKKVKGNLEASADYEEAVLNTDVSFIVVATPSLADGSFSNEYLEKSLHKIAEALRKKKSYHLIVVTNKHIAVIESRQKALPGLNGQAVIPALQAILLFIVILQGLLK